MSKNETPEDHGVILLAKVKAALTFDPSRKQNKLHMTNADTNVDVLEGDKKLGSIRACIGGGIELIDSATRRTYTVSSSSLWTAFSNALEKLEKGKSNG